MSAATKEAPPELILGKIDPADYSFCEATHATSYSYWHIRRLIGRTKHLGGGIDSESLCGHVRPNSAGGWGGWDLAVSFITYIVGAKRFLRLRAGICNRCWTEWERLIGEGISK